MQQLTQGSYGTMYYVQDMQQAKDFYEKSIGLTPRFENENWTEFDLGDGTALCLHQMKPESPRILGGALIVNVEKIQEKVNELKKQGVEFLRGVSEVFPGAFSADFHDPSGNLISLYENTNQTS